MPRLNFRRVAWIIAILGIAAEFAAAASTLADFVPNDAGVCLTLEEAAPHVERFISGPLYARLNAYPPLAQWRRENVPELKKIAAEVSRQLGVGVPDVWRHILGRQTLLAVWPPEDAQKQGPALLLVETDDAQLLVRLVAGIHSAQQRAGDVLESHDIDYRGVKVQSRLVRKGESSERIFLATVSHLGMLANQQRLIEQVVDLQLARGAAAARLSQLPAYQEAMEQIDAAAPAKLFLNPRVWDAALARAVAAGDQPHAPGRQLVTQAWRSLRYGVFAFALHPQARAEGYLAFDAVEAETAVAEVLGALGGPAVLLERTPAEALAAAAGTADITRLVRWISSSSPEADRRRGLPEILWSLIDGTFQGLGPGFGAFLLPPRAGSEFPLAAVAAAQIQQRAAARQANALTPADALRTLLQATIPLVPPRAGVPPPKLKAEKLGETEILTLTGLPETPPGVAPSFAFAERTMFVGISPPAVQAAVTLAPDSSLASSPRFRELLGPRLTKPSQVGYANLRALRQWLAEHREAIAALLAGKEEQKLEETRRGLEQLQGLLGVADYAAAAAQIEPRGIRLSASAMVVE